jgi:SAM-dependent methyltransferase
MKADTAFTGSIPALYDRYMVPMLFAPYAEDMTQRLRTLGSGRLLEIAAGTGAVTRVLRAALPPSVAIVATDLNQAMLDFAAAQPGAGAVEWRQADAGALPFPDASFDAVVCQFGVMFFPDKAKAYAEAARVLVPGGRFLFSTWDALALSPIAETAASAVAEQFPHDPPSFFARIPHAYHDEAAITATLRAAGFARTETERVERRCRALSPREAALGICQGSPLRNEIEARDAAALERVTEAAAAALARRFGPGPIEAPMRAVVVTASL